MRRSIRIALPFLLIIGSVSVIQIARLISLTNKIQNEMISLEAIVGENAGSGQTPNDLARGEQVFVQIGEDFRDLRSTLGPVVYLLPLLQWVPRYGGDIANVAALIDLGERVAAVGRETLQIANAFNLAVEEGQMHGTPAAKRLLDASPAQRGAIERAQRSLDSAVQARQRVDSTVLTPSLQQQLARLDRWLPLWKSALDMALLAPLLLGTDRPRTYLLVAQNSDELRATGGFVSGVAQIRVDRGEILIGEFQDSFLVDKSDRPHSVPPEALKRFMGTSKLVFRDANWSPDFPTSARAMAELYQLDEGVTVDGVIAVNFSLVPKLMQVVGAITVSPSNERVDAKNVVEKIQDYWTHPQTLGSRSDWWLERKEFIGNLFQAVMRRVITGEIDRARLMRVLLDGLQSKDLLLYVGEGAFAPTGSIDAANQAALMIVDSNLGYNKVDANIDRQVDYKLRMGPGGDALATLIVKYTNTSPDVGTFCIHQPVYLTRYEDLQQGCYWDYVRIVAPAGSELIRMSGVEQVVQESPENGRPVFGGYFVLPRGASRSFQVDYRIPRLSSGSSGTVIDLEKQPGAPPIGVRLYVVPPPGTQIGSSTPSANEFYEEGVAFNLLLDRDQQVRMVFEPISSEIWLAAGIPIGLFAVSMFKLYGYVQRSRTSRGQWN